jgi:glyoxylase-like metal-dependent hydrolase (beta-lactamase superfamily II)
MEIADGIFTYRGRGGESIRPGAGSSSVTVVRDDGLVMIDAGVVSGGAFDDLTARMKADGLDPRDIRLVVFTHAHWDHLNAAARVIACSGARTAAGKKEVPFIEDSQKSFDAFVPGFGEFTKEIFPFPLFVARFLVRYAWGRQPEMTGTGALSDGDLIGAKREIRAVALPGHTDGHMGFFIPDAGVLASGDLFDFENAEGMDLNNPRSSFDAAVDSLTRAAALGAGVLIPGHGEPVVGKDAVRETLRRALTAGLEFPVVIGNVLGERPLRLKEILRAAFPGTPFAMEAMKLMLVLVVLLSMEKTGRAVRVSRNGKPAWVAGKK